MRLRQSWFMIALSFCGICLTHGADASDERVPSSPSQDQVEILYYEELPPMSLQRQAVSGAEDDAEKTKFRWSFESFGRSFDLVLEPNDRLIAKLPIMQHKKIVRSHQLYKGKVEGIEDSWVRLTRSGKKWHGMIWDGHEMYIIDPMSVMERALPGFSLARSSAHGMYRLSDSRELESVACGNSPSDLTFLPRRDYGALVQELQERVTASAAGASLNLDMAVVADVEFSSAQQNLHNTSTNAAVIARMNVVDGVFSEQVGVQINLVDIQELSDNGSLTSTNPRTLLDQFGALTSSNTFSNPGVAHLFTGRDLDSNVIGIAYISTLCSSRFGIGVNEVIGGGTARALLVAHELAHNFGSPHDNETGSACANTPNGFIMNPVINGSDQFSQCSIAQMQPEINSASCITVVNLNESDLQLTFPNSQVESNVGASFGYAINVHNHGPDAATDAMVALTLPTQLNVQNISVNSGTCTSGSGGQFDCEFGSIPNGETRTINLTLLGQVPGQYLVQASASALNDQTTGNNAGQGDIEILSPSVVDPAMTSPEPLSQLSSGAPTFQWTANTTPVVEWWLYVGRAQGNKDILSSGSIAAGTLSRTVTGIPTDGGAVWVRLWWRTDADDWQSVDIRYTAATQSGGATPQIVSPAPGTQLPGSSVSFSWSPNAVSVSKWWLHVGGSTGGLELYDSGSLGTSLSHTVTGLPTDGRTIWVRLWYLASEGWQSIDVQYTAATQPGGTTPQMVSPIPGSQLQGPSVLFSWTPNGLDVTKWWLHVGGSRGEFDLADSGSLGTNLSYTVTGLPLDGGSIWVRLWYQTVQGWQSVDIQYTIIGASGT